MQHSSFDKVFNSHTQSILFLRTLAVSCRNSSGKNSHTHTHTHVLIQQCAFVGIYLRKRFLSLSLKIFFLSSFHLWVPTFQAEIVHWPAPSNPEHNFLSTRARKSFYLPLSLSLSGSCAECCWFGQADRTTTLTLAENLVYSFFVNRFSIRMR